MKPWADLSNSESDFSRQRGHHPSYQIEHQTAPHIGGLVDLLRFVNDGVVRYDKWNMFIHDGDCFEQKLLCSVLAGFIVGLFVVSQRTKHCGSDS